jgi:DTW domain-containing protein YfiP
MNICCPHSQMYMSGIQEQERAMIDRLRANPQTSFVLFPSKDSISVEQFLSRFSQNEGESAITEENKGKGKGKERVEGVGTEEGGVMKALGNLKVSDIPQLNIVIIDGTWNQAKHLIYNIPANIPRVHINPTSPSLLLLRKVSLFSFYFFFFFSFFLF